MLTRIRAKNFRLFRVLDLELAKGLPTVLIGPNASGKTTVLEILNFGALLAYGQTVEQIVNVQRGGFDLVSSWGGWTPFSIAFEFSTDVGKYSYSATVAGQRHAMPWMEAEEVQFNGTPIVTYADRSLTIFDGQGGRVDRQSWGGKAGQSPALTLNLVGDEKAKLAQQAIESVRQHLSVMHTYGPFLIPPAWTGNTVGARQSAVVGPAMFLDRSGFNLINVLFQRNQRRETWNHLLNELSKEFPHVEDMFFPPDPGGGRISLGWRDGRRPEANMYASQMSEGMLQYLCMLASLLIPRDTASVLAFDEPDNHLHPSAVNRIASIANVTAGHTPVVIATHNDRILDVLADPAESIRVCTTDDDGAHIEKLDQPSINAFLEHYDASDLRRRGMMDPDNAEDPVKGPSR